MKVDKNPEIRPVTIERIILSEKEPVIIERIFPPEEADKLVEVANAIPVNRSTKAIPVNILCFLFIVTEMFTLFVLFMLIYPSSIEKCPHEKNREFDKNNTIYSWVDLFVMLDYTEINLWWLLIFKERLKNESRFHSGKTMYYYFYPHVLDKKEEAKLSLLESFGINVIKKDVGKNYENVWDAYDDLINKFPKLRG